MTDKDLLCKIIMGYSENYGDDDCCCGLANIGLSEKELENGCSDDEIKKAKELGYLE